MEPRLESCRPFAGTGLACVRGGRPVFRGLDFAVAPGEALVLLGPNGGGKSSLLRIMAGLLTPAAGTLTWDGKPLDSTHGGRIGWVGHLDAVKPALTVAEHLDRHGPAGAHSSAVDPFGLEPLWDLPARFLSAGQKRRLALGRLARRATPLWLLDEPTVGLDAASVAAFALFARSHLDEGGAIVAATHLDLGLPARELSL